MRISDCDVLNFCICYIYSKENQATVSTAIFYWFSPLILLKIIHNNSKETFWVTILFVTNFPLCKNTMGNFETYQPRPAFFACTIFEILKVHKIISDQYRTFPLKKKATFSTGFSLKICTITKAFISSTHFLWTLLCIQWSQLIRISRI